MRCILPKGVNECKKDESRPWYIIGKKVWEKVTDTLTTHKADYCKVKKYKKLPR